MRPSLPVRLPEDRPAGRASPARRSSLPRHSAPRRAARKSSVHWATSRLTAAVTLELECQGAAELEGRGQQHCRRPRPGRAARRTSGGYSVMGAQLAARRRSRCTQWPRTGRPSKMKRRTRSRVQALFELHGRANGVRAKRVQPLSRCRARGSAAELLLQQLVQLGRVGLAAGGLHDLADEEAEQLVLAGAEVGELARILRHAPHR